MSQQYLGEIRLVGFNFAPQGWFLCQGQTLAIQQYAALFSLLGTTYGGNGTSTFNLPDLRGRVPIHQGTLQGGGTFVIGEVAGSETVTLNTNQVPEHQHPWASAATADTEKLPGGYLATIAAGGSPVYSTTFTSLTPLDQSTIGNAEAGQPHDNMAPYVTLTFIIAMVGIFPSRN
jgi:microcystin-dependent protein